MALYLFGDSITRGTCYQEARGRYANLEHCFATMLQERLCVPVENCGRFGATIAKGSKLLEKKLDKMEPGSTVLLEFGGNDCDYDWADIAADPTFERACKTPMEDFIRQYADVIYRLRKAGMKPVMMTLPPLEAERFYHWISQDKDAENILTYLGDVDHIFRWQASYSDAVRKIAEFYGVPLLDVRADFLAKENFADGISADGMHPNTLGHQWIAESLLRQMETKGILPLSQPIQNPVNYGLSIALRG